MLHNSDSTGVTSPWTGLSFALIHSPAKIAIASVHLSFSTFIVLSHVAMWTLGGLCCTHTDTPDLRPWRGGKAFLDVYCVLFPLHRECASQHFLAAE